VPFLSCLQYLGGVAPLSTLDRDATIAAFGLSEEALEELRQEAVVEPEPFLHLEEED